MITLVELIIMFMIESHEITMWSYQPINTASWLLNLERSYDYVNPDNFGYVCSYEILMKQIAFIWLL